MRKAIAALFAVILAAPASATTLSVDMTVDNAFSLYISTNDSLPGTLVGTGADWTQTYHFTPTLTPGVTNYIHVQAGNAGGPGTFIGDFQLSDASFSFANGAQLLVTNAVDWDVSTVGFGGPYMTPADNGVNGTSPWGLRPGIDANAHFIWEPGQCDVCTIYFSTAVTFAIPEPGIFAMLLAGFGLLGFVARRAHYQIG